jgi:hypothetical protein
MLREEYVASEARASRERTRRGLKAVERAKMVLEEQTIEGPLHEGTYAGHCLSGDDLHEAVMTLDQAKQWLHQHPEALGFTFQSDRRDTTEPVRCWFKSRLRVLYHPDWWTISIGRGMD